MNKISNEYVLNRSRINGVNDSNKTSQIDKMNDGNKSFKEVFDQINRSDKVNFSKHAMQRLEKRNINLSTEDIDKISDAVNKEKNKDSVFTNIDGAVII